MDRKKKILFISKHVVHDGISMAGHKLFSNYLKKFCEDDKFEVGIAVVHKGDADYQKMKQQFGSKSIDYSKKIPKLLTAFTYLYYNTYIRMLFSFINPEYYYLDPIYNYFFTKAINRVKKSGWEPDVIMFEWTEVLFLFDKVDKMFNNSIKAITEQDVTFIKISRRFGDKKIYKSFIEGFKKRELSLLNKFDLVTLVSFDDMARLMECGVDRNKLFLMTPYFQMKNISQENVEKDIIYYGAMNRAENQEAVAWFIDNVFVPFNMYKVCSFTIVGAGVPDSFLNKYKKNDSINFTGFVDDPEVFFKKALCMVVPLTNGGGIKIKVLEAMSCSVTVLTNNIGIEGINAVPDVSYLYCLEPESYYENVKKLLDNKDLSKQIGEQGRVLINKDFNFEKGYIDYRNHILNGLKN